MSFDIRFIGVSISKDVEIGSIKLESYKEKLIIPTSHWKKDDYEKQWYESIKSIVDGAQKSALVVEIYPAGIRDFVNVWPMYRNDDHVYVQNRLIFLDEHPNLDVNTLSNEIGEREAVDEEGNKISEWHVRVSDLSRWLGDVKAQR